MNRQIRMTLLLAAIGLVFALPAQAYPLTNPSTTTIWDAAGWGAFKDTTFVFAGGAAGDTAMWSWGFPARKIMYLNDNQHNWMQFIGLSTLKTATTRSKVPVGPTKNQPVFSSSKFFVPSYFGENLDPTGCRGIKLWGAAAGDSIYVRAYK